MSGEDAFGAPGEAVSDPASYIGRYYVPVTDGPYLFNLSSDPITVEGCTPVGDSLQFWVIITPGFPCVTRAFVAVGTGHPLPPGYETVWGSGRVAGQRGLWHLVEVPVPAPGASS
jgi:hypothetical protein